MTKYESLFEQQSVIGAKIEKYIVENGYTKSEFCDKSGISRPTLDKILKGASCIIQNVESSEKEG